MFCFTCKNVKLKKCNTLQMLCCMTHVHTKSTIQTPHCCNEDDCYIIFYSLHCPLSGPDLTYISLWIIHCIIYYVTNKETLNLENIPQLFCPSIRRSLYSHIFTAVLRSVFQLLIIPSVWLFSLDFKSDQSPIITLSA